MPNRPAEIRYLAKLETILIPLLVFGREAEVVIGEAVLVDVRRNVAHPLAHPIEPLCQIEIYAILALRGPYDISLRKRNPISPEISHVSAKHNPAFRRPALRRLSRRERVLQRVSSQELRR